MSFALLQGGRLATASGTVALRSCAACYQRYLSTSIRLSANTEKILHDAQKQQQPASTSSSASSSSSHPTLSSKPLDSKHIPGTDTPAQPSRPHTRSLPSLDFTAVAVPAGARDGANRPTGARSSKESLSTIERRRRFLGRLSLTLLGLGLVGAWVYMGREWEQGEDAPQVCAFSVKHPCFQMHSLTRVYIGW